jgi:hypothetical protein
MRSMGRCGEFKRAHTHNSPLSFPAQALTFVAAFANSVETKQVQVKFSQQRPFHV